LLRYQPPDINKYQNARDIFSRTQEDGESVNLFIDKMQKSARLIVMSEHILKLAILNGLQLRLQNFVRQKEPKTLDDVISAARLAELTIPTENDIDATLHAKLDRMMQNIEDSKATTVPIPPGELPIPTRAAFGDSFFDQPNLSGERKLKQPNIIIIIIFISQLNIK